MQKENLNTIALPKRFDSNEVPMFEIHTLEWIAANHPEQFGRPNRSSSFEIIWIKQSSGTFTIDLNKHGKVSNTVYCMDVGQVKLLQPGKNITGYHISFSPQFLYLSQDNEWPLFKTKGYCSSGMAGVIPVDDELQLEMEDTMGKMIKELTSYSALKSDLLKGLLKLLMIYLTRRADVKRPAIIADRSNVLVQNFMGLLENNLTKKKMVSEYARELHLTPSQLNDTVKRVTGFTVNYHIQQRKVLEAKRQLIHYGISMKEIAYYLGFDDISHFSKFFKVHSGGSFQTFKKGLSVDSLMF